MRKIEFADGSIGYLAEEKATSAKERNALPDSAFGLPDERKYPLTDAAHVKSAISYFHKCPEAKKPILAKNILKACKKYHVEINKDAEWYQYTKK